MGGVSAHAQVKRIVQILLVVGAGVEIHGQQVLWRHTGTSGVQLQLADRDPSAISAKVSKPEDAARVRHADEPDILLGPVSQDLFHLAAARDRQIHAARLAIVWPNLRHASPIVGS